MTGRVCNRISFIAALSSSRLAVLSPLVGIVVILTAPPPAWGIDVPFTEHVISTTADGAVSVFATDLDGDGDVDILSASFGDNKIAWYENDGGSPPTFTEWVISTGATGASAVFATDLDRDGDIDVLSASWLDDKIAWYENGGGSPLTFTERVITKDPGEPFSGAEGFADGPVAVFAADLDGDGDMDVLSASDLDDKIAWYENDGGSPPTFTAHVIASVFNGTSAVFAADLDGDGDIDVLSAAHSDTKFAWYENDGASPVTFQVRVLSWVTVGSTSVFATDVDGDGDTDVLSASRVGDKIAWHDNVGGTPPTFPERVISTTADAARSVFATDVDGDGDIDVLSASPGDDKIAWYESDGGSPPSFTERVISTTADKAWSVFAIDLDDDGDTDVLSASVDDDKIAWYENTTPLCGNGSINPGEECDDGPDNSDTQPDACRTNCTAAGCGDGVLDDGEECDDGPSNSDTEPDACRTDCTAAGCGDGVADTGEECDDGNREWGDTCDENCLIRGACCDALRGACLNRVSPESCQSTHASFHLGVDCHALDPECAAAFGACCRDELDQPGGVRSCTSITLDECRCPSCEWFKLQLCEEVIADELCTPDFFPIPTTSEWGLVILTLLLVTGGKVCFGRRSSTSRS